MRQSALALVGSLLLLACGTAPQPDDGGTPDAGAIVRDAQPRDAQGELDAQAPVDAGGALEDATAPDAGVVTTVVVRYAGMPGAITLRGSGGGLDWAAGVATEPGPDGTFVWTTTALDAPIELKPVLGDETWARGPNYHLAPGERIEIAPRFAGDGGRVTTLVAAFASSIVGGVRPVLAYLPASYDENTAARYPVVYMHDGQNLFDPATAAFGVEWQVDEAMDAAASAGLCPDGATVCQNDDACGGARCDTFREAIVIGVGNTSARMEEYTPTDDPTYGGGRADEYLRALIEELAPMVDAALRTRTGPAETALVGSSLGGLVSSYGGVRHPDVFGLIGAMSPSTWWDGRVILGEVASIPTRPTRALRVYVDSGDPGDGSVDTRDLARAYETAGYVDGDDLEYVVAPGHMHREADWALRVPGALRFLLGPRERALP